MRASSSAGFGCARDAGIYALQMWAYICGYEMPNDKPDQLLRRLGRNSALAFDSVEAEGNFDNSRPFDPRTTSLRRL